jgi:hypothetical protein
MEQYTIIKSFVMLMALVGAFSFFSCGSGGSIVMMAVEGTTEFKLDHVGRRIGVLFKDVLGQANVRRKKMPGIAHTLIFFGFLAVQPHSLELMFNGVCPAFEVGHWIPGLYGGYLFVADILAAFVLVGFAYAIYRRTLLRPSYLTLGTDANLIILFTCLIIITFQTINAFQTLLPVETGAYDYRGNFPVSSLLVGFFGLNSDEPAAGVCRLRNRLLDPHGHHPGVFGLHPRFQTSASAGCRTQCFIKTAGEREKAIAKTDIENEELETFGLGKVSELNWKNVLNLYACTECGRCEEQCPAANTDKPLSPKK